MIKYIKILTLYGCPYCEKLIQKLNIEKISFENISCAKNEDACDKAEKIANCELYPMIVLKTIHDKIVYICLSNEYNKIGSYEIINRDSIIYYLHSIDNMIELIKKI